MRLDVEALFPDTGHQLSGQGKIIASTSQATGLEAKPSQAKFYILSTTVNSNYLFSSLTN